MPEHGPRDPAARSQARPTPLGRASEELYDTLRDMARAKLAVGGRQAALEPAELVHECYLKLASADGIEVADRATFLALASRVLRQLLVDEARARARVKRGGGWCRIELEGQSLPRPERPEHLIALDDALDKLARLSERQARVVELRFFAGLSVAETAEVLGCEAGRVESDWQAAKAWLKRELGD